MTSCQRGGHVAFLCVLIVNLSMIGFYRRAFAGAPVPAGAMAGTIAMANTAMLTGCDDGLLEGDVADYQDLFAEQEFIYETAFAGEYSWCTGSTWILDQEVDAGPANPLEVVPYTGHTFDGQQFTVEVSVYVPVNDWAQSSDVTPEMLQFVADHQFTMSVVGGRVLGPEGAAELWGFAQSLTSSDGIRSHIFIPFDHGGAIPEILATPTSMYNGGPLGTCLQDALEDYQLCLEQARADLAICIGAAALAEGAALLGCLVRKAYTGTFGWGLCGLAFAVIAGVALVGCIAQYLNNLDFCKQQYDLDVRRCYRDNPLPGEP